MSRKYSKGIECWKFGNKLGLTSRLLNAKIARLLEGEEGVKSRIWEGERG